MSDNSREVEQNTKAYKAINIVAKHYGFKRCELFSRSRRRQLVLARHLAMYFCREYTSYSFPEIGDLFFRDHSSVIHGCKRIENDIRRDYSFSLLVDNLDLEIFYTGEKWDESQKTNITQSQNQN